MCIRDRVEALAAAQIRDSASADLAQDGQRGVQSLLTQRRPVGRFVDDAAGRRRRGLVVARVVERGEPGDGVGDEGPAVRQVACLLYTSRCV